VHAHDTPADQPDDDEPGAPVPGQGASGEQPGVDDHADAGISQKDDAMNAAEPPTPAGTDAGVSVAEPATPPTQSTGEILPEGGAAGRRRRKNATRQAIEWLALVAGAVVLALVIRGTLFQAFYIPSASMSPTLEVNDRILVNKASYKLHSVHRGDIVVFKAPPGESTENIKDLVKRVIGLPGDRLSARDNHVYVIPAGQTAGHELNEPYVKSTPDCPAGTQGPVAGRTLEPITVPAGEYFMMGDNRCASEDSRAFGPIKKSSIIGRAFIRIWPLTRIKIL
jgi:signal peptidase I